MKILYFIPFVNTVYAGRTIYHGYKNAFVGLGHDFKTLTAKDNHKDVFNSYSPDIFFMSLNNYTLKYLDLVLLRKEKKRGMRIFISIPFWRSPLSLLRINESYSLENDKNLVSIINSGLGDIYYNICSLGDPRMEGFYESTGQEFQTVLLAADKTAHFPQFSEQFVADISFIGTNLPEKRLFFKKNVFPLAEDYKLKLYGQDWTLPDRCLGWIQRFGHYYNVPVLRCVQKPKFGLEAERQIYTSSLISINVHEEYQRRFGLDTNERTFKIPACGGFEITDDVACIRNYFISGEEIVIAENSNDWYDKIRYYIKNPDKRLPIIERGRTKVLNNHTYHHRALQFIKLSCR